MKKKSKLDVNKLLGLANTGPSRWELDNIVYSDRTTNPVTLRKFLERIQELRTTDAKSVELSILESLAQELDQAECEQLMSDDDELAQQNFIEDLARRSAVEVLTRDKVTFETMNVMCKLAPNDFILTAKRTQDIINSIHELVIQGETLSRDVAGA
jgi:sulfite reductase alpha subunit-like flavoprotein